MSLLNRKIEVSLRSVPKWVKSMLHTVQKVAIWSLKDSIGCLEYGIKVGSTDVEHESRGYLTLD